jgi:hypothetical protein
MQQPSDIGAVHAHPTPFQLHAKLVQCQLAHFDKPQPDKRGMRAKLAPTDPMALATRLERAGLRPQLHQVVHEPRRHSELARRLPVSTTFINIRGNTLTQRHR